jgi:hypothetical protein
MRTTSVARPKVPVSPDDYRLVREHPGQLGLDPSSSEASRLQELLHEGIRARRDQVRRQARLESYATWAEDRENAAAVASARADAKEHGGALAEFRKGS